MPSAAFGDFWSREPSGALRVDLPAASSGGSAGLVMCGNRVLVRVMFPADDGQRPVPGIVEFGWPVLKKEFRGGTLKGPVEAMPEIRIDGRPLATPRRAEYRYDGVFTVVFDTVEGIRLKREILPCVDRRAVLDVWTIENTGGTARSVAVPGQQKVVAEAVCATGEPAVFECEIAPLAEQPLKPGATAGCAVVWSLRKTAEPQSAIDVQAEVRARRALLLKAQETMVLESPEPVLDDTLTLAKLRLLESGCETRDGVIQSTGSLDYFCGTWTNDNVEYASPAVPFMNHPPLTDATNTMYRLWLNDETTFSSRIVGSYETYLLRRLHGDRGDESMMLYGLSSYLLASGRNDLAAEFWPIIEQAVKQIREATNDRGVVESRTDELEGRLPTGTANLSTSTLACAGLRRAHLLAQALGKSREADTFSRMADALERAIESYFGATVEGFETYRYYEGNDVLRGWICLPLALGIQQRREGTLAALFSSKLWYESNDSTGLRAVSTQRSGEWMRETYYALRAGFLVGDPDATVARTVQAVRCHILSQRGPYIDEDAGDLLAATVLYLRVVPEGLFGIEPRSFETFACTPHMPKSWPSMRLSNVYYAGRAVDLDVRRDGTQIRLTATCAGKTLVQEAKPEGTPFLVHLGGQR